MGGGVSVLAAAAATGTHVGGGETVVFWILGPVALAEPPPDALSPLAGGAAEPAGPDRVAATVATNPTST